MTLATTTHHAEVILDADDTGDDCNGGMMLGTTADRLAALRDDGYTVPRWAG